MVLLDIKRERKHSQETIETMADMIKSGKSYREVGREFNLSGGTIYTLVHKWANMYKPGEELPPENYVTIKEFCLNHGYSYSNVYYHIKSKDINHVYYHNMIYIDLDTQIVNDKLLSDEIIEDIYYAKSIGLNNSQISRLLGISRTTIKYYLEFE